MRLIKYKPTSSQSLLRAQTWVDFKLVFYIFFRIFNWILSKLACCFQKCYFQFTETFCFCLVTITSQCITVDLIIFSFHRSLCCRRWLMLKPETWSPSTPLPLNMFYALTMNAFGTLNVKNSDVQKWFLIPLVP